MASEPYRVMEPAPTKQRPTDPQTLKDIEHVEEHGYVILENIFSVAEAEEAKTEINRLRTKDLSGPRAGRNEFEGFQTERIYGLLDKSRTFDKFLLLPRVLALNDYFLDERYALNSLHTIQINPSEEPQELHHDDAYCNVPRPRRPFSTAIMVALDPFTASNGATAVIPGSHLWPSGVTPDPSKIISAVCPQGSAVYFIGTLWHGGGRNTSTSPRQSLTVQYCQPWVRPTENMILSVDPRKLGEIDERIVRMMGYQVGRPFIGYVDGMGVRRGVERFIKWVRGEVDWSPRTFERGSDGNSRL